MHHRLLAWARRVIAGELAEGTFLCGDVLDHLALEHDLGMCWHRQAVNFAWYDIVGFAAMAGCIVVFRETEFQLVAAGEEQQWIMSAGDQHRAGLAGLEIFLP